MRALVPGLFFGVSLWFVLDPFGGEPPVEPTPDVDAAAIDPAPRRKMLGDPPLVRIGGVDQRCSDCHAGFESLAVTPDRIQQHTGLVHDHGMNDRCFNCHSRDDRDWLELHDGEKVPFSDSARSCAECHGTLYRDWSLGMHGRTQGSWDASSDAQRRLQCVECHDPHAPAFPPFEPLPGPHTFRMGHQDATQRHDPSRPLSPLRKALEGSEDHR